MKWHNEDRKTRRENWYVVPGPAQVKMLAAKDWCNQHTSTGKYYCHYTNRLRLRRLQQRRRAKSTSWWFEREDDAALFTIIWG